MKTRDMRTGISPMNCGLVASLYLFLTAFGSAIACVVFEPPTSPGYCIPAGVYKSTNSLTPMFANEDGCTITPTTIERCPEDSPKCRQLCSLGLCFEVIWL